MEGVSILNYFLQITNAALVCSAHLSKDDFKWSAVWKTLKVEVLLHIFNWGSNQPKRRKLPKKRSFNETPFSLMLSHNYYSDNSLLPRFSCSRQVTLCRLYTLLLLSGDIATNPEPINFGLCNVCSLKKNYAAHVKWFHCVQRCKLCN